MVRPGLSMQIMPPKPSTFILSAGNILEKDKTFLCQASEIPLEKDMGGSEVHQDLLIYTPHS